MSPERDPSDVAAVPPLAADFAQRVLRQAKHQRRRRATLRVAFGLGASLAVAVLVVRPARVPVVRLPAASALAANDLGDGDLADSAEPQDEDPGSYFFPDAQADSQSEAQAEGQLAADAQVTADDELPEGAAGNEDSEE